MIRSCSYLITDQPSYSFSASQIFKPPTSKQPFKITHNTVGHKENTQVAVQVVHEDSLVGQDCIMVTGHEDWLLEYEALWEVEEVDKGEVIEVVPSTIASNNFPIVQESTPVLKMP